MTAATFSRVSPLLLFRAGNMIQYKTYQCASKAVDAEAGIYELMPSVETVDRDGDVLVATGADLNAYRRNPVVLYAHDYTDLPIAKALAIDVVPGVGLRAQIQFAPPGANPKADSVRALWAAGFLNAASVGFVPRAADPPANGQGRRFTDWELLEFSIVPVPANADALRLAAKSLRPEQKRGRVLSGVNEKRIRDSVELLTAVLSQLDSQQEPTPESDGVREESAPQAETKAPEVRAAIPPHETPMADSDAEWDGPGVVASLPAEREALRMVYAWVDPKGDPDAKQSYKFPHHLASGEVVLRGVNNAMARLGQADIPAGDRAGVEAHLRRHQEQFAEEDQEEAEDSATVKGEGDGDENVAEVVSEQLASQLAELVQIIKEFTNGR